MDVLPPAPISAAVTLRLVTPHGDAVLVDSLLSYDPSDPYAIRVGFDAGRDAPVEWTFARELLTAGIKDLTGDGDVRVWPSPYPGRRSSVCISLSTPSGSALFEADRADLADFLNRTFTLVPGGREGDYLDVDAALATFLTESWLAD